MQLKSISLIVYGFITASVSQRNDTKDLNLLGFLPMTGQGWAGGGACLPAVLMAVRHVNERPGLLDDYNLTYTWVDTQVRVLSSSSSSSQYNHHYLAI